jgi:hypothetical protein
MNKKTIAAILVSSIFFIGCSSNNITDNFDKVEATNNIFEIDKNVFIKGVILDLGETNTGAKISQTIYVFCDKDGHILADKGLSFSQSHGKYSNNVSVVR